MHSPNHEPQNSRKGKFVGMQEQDRQLYIKSLKKKISDGYFYSDAILSRIVDDIAPVFSDSVDLELNPE